MDLDRAHADAEVEGNLLVRSARNQGVKNLPLTRTQRFIAHPEVTQFAVPLAPDPVSLQRDPDRIEQILRDLHEEEENRKHDHDGD